jgi:rhamnose utilization protein RhaD (predicted bifunctional aldolase and dehydrogenase)
MKSGWVERDAQTMVDRYARQGIGSDLALRIYTSRLLGREPKLVLHGGGNTSVKTRLRDLLGEEVEVLCVKGSGGDLAAIGSYGDSAFIFRSHPDEQESPATETPNRPLKNVPG